MVAQKVLSKQLNQRSKDQQPRRDSVHGSHENQTELGIWRVEAVGGETDCLADGCSVKRVSKASVWEEKGGETGREGLRAAVGKDHEPGLKGLFGPGDGGDARAEGEAFEGFWGVLVR